MGALGHERCSSRALRMSSAPTLLVTLPSRAKEFTGNLRAVLGPSPRRLPLELNLNRVSTRGLATSAVLHAGVLAVMLALPGIGRNEPFVFEDKPPDVTVIYYPATSLPAIKDSGGSVSGSQGAAGGRAAHHPGQTIHVSRAIPMNPAAADAPKLLLPRVSAPTANLLALSASPAALPVLAVPVELARRESKIARPEQMRETKPAADASQLKLQRGKMPDLPPSIVAALPVLAVPVELTRRESKIARPEQMREPKPAADALQLKLQRGRMPDPPPSIVDTPAKVVLASPVPVPLPPPPRPVLPKEVATEISSSSTSALQTLPLKPVPAVAEPNVHNEGGASAGKRQELVVSARPGDVIGVPANGKAASLALSPSGNAEPGIGKEGRGIGAARGFSTGSTASGGWTGGSVTGSGPGSNSAVKGGVSPEPGPSGAGRGSASAIPGVDIRGGVVTLDSFGPKAVSGRPSVAMPAQTGANYHRGHVPLRWRPGCLRCIQESNRLYGLRRYQRRSGRSAICCAGFGSR
jgi:hypothetical protein